MKRSITAKLMLGTMFIILLPMAAISLFIARDISTLSVNNFTNSATNELKQVGTIISTVLDESRLNVSALAALPIQQRLDELTTTYIDTKAPATIIVGEEDALGRELTPLFQATRQSHPNYLQVYVGIHPLS